MRFIHKLILLFLLVIAVSCERDRSGEGDTGEALQYHIKLGVTTESISIIPSPMSNRTKGYPNDLYAIQVRHKQSGSSLYSNFGFGLFTDPDLIELDLSSDKSYIIEVTMIPDGLDLIAKNATGGYLKPFTMSGIGKSTDVTNEFTTENMYRFNALEKGTTDLADGDSYVSYQRPNISRYYGIIEDFSPSADGILAMELKWVVFGITVLPENFTEGKILIEMDGAPDIEITPDHPNKIEKELFTFENGAGENWHNDGYQEAIPMNIIWKKEGQPDKYLLTKSDSPTPVFVRKHEHTITIRLAGNAGGDNDIELTTEDDELLPGTPIVVEE